MLAYQYNPENGWYVGESDCQIDPVRSKKEGKEIYLLPGDSTFVSPPEYDNETEIPVWNGGEWIVELLPVEPEPEPEEPDEDIETRVTALESAIERGLAL